MYIFNYNVYIHIYTSSFNIHTLYVATVLGKESLLLTDHLTDGYFTSCIFSPDASMMVTASREPNWEEAWPGRMGKS